jgi:hypothetical protein
VLEKREALLGPDHVDTLFAADCLAGWHLNQSDHGAAQPLFSRVVQGRKAAPTLGPTHAETLTSMHRLAIVYENLQQPDEAEAIYKQVGTQHPTTTLSGFNIDNRVRRYGQTAERNRSRDDVRTITLHIRRWEYDLFDLGWRAKVSGTCTESSVHVDMPRPALGRYNGARTTLPLDKVESSTARVQPVSSINS